MFRELENSHCKEQNKIIEAEKATKCRNNSVVIICYLNILRLMVTNTVVRTEVTFNPSQDLKKKKISQKEAKIMTDKEQNKQNKVLLILVRVNNPSLL